nr:FAD binding domain-containing protein [uncultured Duganella sp.]
MDKPAAPRALIIGGSLSGLFAATALRRIGWQVAVYERSPNELSGRGGGLVLQPEVLAAIEFAGLGVDGALGVPSGDRIFLNRAGQVVQRSHAPQAQSSWNLLYGVLKRGLPAGLVHANEQLVRFDQHAGGVKAYFASGREASGALLIGADGPSSAVRAQLLPDRVPTYAGYVAWRGLVPELQVAAPVRDLLQGVFAFQHGDGHMLLEYMAPGRDESTQPGKRRWNWVWYRKVAAGAQLCRLMTDAGGTLRRFSVAPGAVKQRDAAALREDAQMLLAPVFQQLIAATEQPFIQSIIDLAVPQMVFGRAVLIGDAAFIARPHTAGGAAKAASDARMLAELLRDGRGGIDAALARWQRARLPAGQALVERGMEAGNRIMNIQPQEER